MYSPAPWQLYCACTLFGYLLGSIPTGFLVGRRYGIDIREHGSGNIGATNVLRVLGKKPGYFVFVCDLCKGLLSARLGMELIWWSASHLTPAYAGSTGFVPSVGHPAGDATIVTLAGIFGAFGCILGHNFPVWLGFRGGKGVATTVGVLLGLMPAAFLVAALVWVTSFYAFRYVSLASLLAAAALPPTVFLLGSYAAPDHHGFSPMFWFAVVAAALVFLRHRANISRLWKGTESRFGRKVTS